MISEPGGHTDTPMTYSSHSRAPHQSHSRKKNNKKQTLDMKGITLENFDRKFIIFINLLLNPIMLLCNHCDNG